MCLICKDERVVWYFDPQWGMATCQPCPNCNKGGMNVANNLEKIKKEIEKNAEVSEKNEV